jgi:hypothetical protein
MTQIKTKGTKRVSRVSRLSPLFVVFVFQSLPPTRNTDWQIEALVYELYGLTEEEIAVMGIGNH